MLEQSFKNVSEDKQKLQEFAKLVQDKSKEVENLSKVGISKFLSQIFSQTYTNCLNSVSGYKLNNRRLATGITAEFGYQASGRITYLLLVLPSIVTVFHTLPLRCFNGQL